MGELGPHTQERNFVYFTRGEESLKRIVVLLQPRTCGTVCLKNKVLTSLHSADNVEEFAKLDEKMAKSWSRFANAALHPLLRLA